MKEHVRTNLFGAFGSLAFAGLGLMGLITTLDPEPPINMMCGLAVGAALAMSMAFCIRGRATSAIGITTAVVLYHVLAALWWGIAAFMTWTVRAVLPDSMIALQVLFSLIMAVGLLIFPFALWAACFSWSRRMPASGPPTSP